jgi:phosphopantetheinyl transferase (holo-ACP synthase)
MEAALQASDGIVSFIWYETGGLKMPLHFQSNMLSRGSNVSIVGLCSWADLDGRYLDCLSEREGRLFACLRHSLRRRSWLAGRMAAKFCFLNSFGAQAAQGSDAWMPRFLRVDSKSLRGFSSWMYQQVEILSENLHPGNRPNLAWSGRASDVRVSLSHANGHSCVYLDSNGSIGLDLEETVVRRDAFYRGNFSAREQAWVDKIGRESGGDSAWLYTLLWTIKEAVIKSDDSGKSTVWGMPQIEIMMSLELGKWLSKAQRGRLGAAFARSKAVVRQHEAARPFHVGISAGAGSILSVLKRIE